MKFRAGFDIPGFPARRTARRRLLLIAVALSVISCRNGHENARTEGGVKHPVVLPAAFEPGQLDSLLRLYPSAAAGEFYRRHALHFSWIDSSGTNEYAGNFMNLFLNDSLRYANDTFPHTARLLQLYRLCDRDETPSGLQPEEAAALDLLLTECFFDYAQKNWKGMPDEKIREASWFIAREPLDAGRLLDSLLKRDARFVTVFAPVFKQYTLLKHYLAVYSRLAAGWPVLSPGIGALRPGDTSPAVPALKQLLFLTGDFPADERTDHFGAGLDSSLRMFQHRHGLPASGYPDSATVRQLSVPLHRRLETILLNMERSRWMPGGQQGDYIAVNIPSFRLLVFADDSLQWSARVIVGETQATHQSVIFSDYLESVVFNPSWTIPRSIAVNEILPSVRRQPDYLATHHMEVIDGKGTPVPDEAIDWQQAPERFPYRIRQLPGPDNALGRVKFLFPNSFSIYLHDTPAKSLFEERQRTFSHGCIRVEDPLRLARFLLRGDSSLTDARVDSILASGKETTVRLTRHIPVFITYFTAWVGRDGRLNFRDDIYGHDKKLESLLFRAGK